MDYPKREQFFAVRFLRLLTKSAAAMTIGADGCMLLLVIVGQEDACRYTRPVNFWNPQLATLIGLRGGDVDGLRRVRERCIRAGWLQYQPGNKQAPARYYVTIPTSVSDIGDGSSDETPQEYSGRGAGNIADKEQQGRQESAENPPRIRRESAENPRPSIPNPIPNPIPVAAAVSVVPGNKPPPPQRPRGWREWQIKVGIKCFIGDGEDEAWRLLYEAEGWDEMTRAYVYLAKTKPGGRLFLSDFQACREDTHAE